MITVVLTPYNFAAGLSDAVNCSLDVVTDEDEQERYDASAIKWSKSRDVWTIQHEDRDMSLVRRMMLKTSTEYGADVRDTYGADAQDQEWNEYHRHNPVVQGRRVE